MKSEIKGKMNVRAFSMITICLTLILIFGISAVSAEQSNIYVNNDTGNDSYTGESPTFISDLIGPKKTISAGISTVSDNGTVNIANGTYTGNGNKNIIIDKNVNIKGESSNSTVINADNDGQIFYITNNVNVTISNLKMTNATLNGGDVNGAIIYQDNGILNLTNCVFENSSAFFKSGGAIFINTGIININNCNFNSNEATIADGGGGDGGAIYNSLGTLNILNTVFNNNIGNHGGAIYNFGTLNVINNTFIGNIGNFGGAITIESGGISQIRNSYLINNTASTFGGAIYNGGNLDIRSSDMENNVANGFVDESYGEFKAGGAIYNYGTAIVYFNRIINNTDYEIDCEPSYGSVDAENNWWGSNDDPSSKVNGPVDCNPWLVMTILSSPTTITKNHSSTITADLTHNSDNSQPTGDHFPDGIPVSFATTLGTISNSTTSNGRAQSKLYGTDLGTADVSATLDNQTLNTTVNVILRGNRKSLHCLTR